MLMEVRNSLKYLFLSIKYNLKASMEYKKSFIIQTIFMMINDGFFLIFWVVVFNVNGGNINGIGMRDILFLWSIPPASFGISSFVFGGLRELNRYIVNGELDSYFVQPKNMILNIATSKCDFGGFGDIAYGLIVGIFACSNFFEYLQLLFYIIIATIITVATIIIIRVLAIWIGEVEQIAHIYENSLFITFTTYPSQIFGNFTKFLMFTIAPAAYVIHLPIKLMENFNIKIFMIVILSAIFYAMLAGFIFNKSIQKYESGNNIVMKD